jgi:hypothetical protein
MLRRYASSAAFPALAMVAVAGIVVATATPAVPRGRPQQAAGLTTVFDSTRDTIVARVAGAVPQEMVKHLVMEMRIKPGIDDTTLFTDTQEFEVDRRGNIWVFDRPSRSIFLFDAAGRLVRRVGTRGAGPGEFNDNGGMVVLRDQRVAQWDPSNARVSFFSPAGDFLTNWPVRGGFGSNNNLVTDSSGQLYTRRPLVRPGGRGAGADGGGSGVLVRYRPGGAFGDTLWPPSFEMKTYAYSALRDGKHSVISAPYAARSLWTWHRSGYFVAGDGSKYHIVIARRNAKPIRIERTAPAVPIPEQERRTSEAAITLMMRTVEPAWTWRGSPLPREKAPLSNIFIARDGRIWAQVPAPSVRIPDGDVTAPRDAGAFAGQTFQQFRAPQAWEVYSPAGSFLGRVSFAEHGELIEADGDRVWTLDRDDDGLPSVVRLRIGPPLANR